MGPGAAPPAPVAHPAARWPHRRRAQDHGLPRELFDAALSTLPRGLKAIIDNPSIGGEKHFELLAVGGVIVTIPMVIVFFIAQRYFVEGIATTGSTGR